MKSAREMREIADLSLDAALNAEKDVVMAKIEAQAMDGLTSLTYYDPISRALFERLAHAGYHITVDQTQGRNETNWEVKISW